MFQDPSLFAELEATLNRGSRPRRFEILCKVTELFLANAATYSDDHIQVFDELMGRLIDRIERQALVELSNKLAPAERAPVNVLGRLSHDDDIEIAGPILKNSKALTDFDLIEIAATKGQAHLSAIAGREQINEQVTDILIDRGDAAVAREVTANRGARFSRFGLDRAVERAEDDESLALAVANRAELPPDLLDRLVRQATDTVRQRLLANTLPELRGRVAEVVSKVSDEVARSVTPVTAGTAAWLQPSRLRARMAQFADEGKLDQLVEAFAALAEIPARTIWDLVRQESDEGLIVLGKASGLGWPDMHKVLTATMPAKVDDSNTSQMFEKFTALSAANAQRAVRFIRTSSSRPKDDLKVPA